MLLLNSILEEECNIDFQNKTPLKRCITILPIPKVQYTLSLLY